MSTFSISSIGTSANFAVSQQTTTTKALSALGSALAASDFDTAKQKVSALAQSLMAALQTSGNSPQALSRLSSSLNSVSKAIDSGNVAAAVQAFQTLQNSYTSFQSVTPALNSGTGESTVMQLIGSTTGSSSSSSPLDSLLSAYASSYVYSVGTNGTVQAPGSTSSTTGSQYSATA